jgi:hypothetical protein
MRIWVPRIVALLALGGVVTALVLAVGMSGASGGFTAEDVETATAELNRANGALSDKLEALEPGASPREAQDAARAAADLTRRLVEDAGDAPEAESLRAVLDIELDYLDAVGSTLNNPRSALRGRVGERGDALRDALQNVAGGDHRVVSGGQELVAYSEVRAGE